MHKAWKEEMFPETERQSLAMIQGDNVLTPEGLRLMLDIHKEVSQLATPDGKRYADLCMKVPTANLPDRRKKRDATMPSNLSEGGLDLDHDYNYDYNSYEDDLDSNIDYDEVLDREDFEKRIKLLDELDPDVYCDIVGDLEKKCLQISLLELWRYNEERIMSVTTQEILDTVNNRTFSPWFKYEFDYSNLLGGVTRNSTGHIVAATATEMIWYVSIPENATKVASQGSGMELLLADQATLDWEELFTKYLDHLQPHKHSVLHYSTREFIETSIKTLFFDGVKLVIGYGIMLGYTMMMLGKWNKVELRCYLTFGGLSCIILGSLASFGITSAFGLTYTPLHPVLSILVLGIGIDDMFVIMQYHKIVEEEEEYRNLTRKEKVAMALKLSGVTIAITTATDILVFIICAISIMPAVQSFCICCTIALLAIFLLQVTLFVACLYLDEVRISQNRHCIVPCIQVEKDESQESDKNVLETKFGLMKEWANGMIETNLYKALIITITAILLGFGIFGTYNIEAVFDGRKVVAKDSAVNIFIETHIELFSNTALTYWKGSVYTDKIDLQDLHKMETLVNSSKVCTKIHRCHVYYYVPS